MDPAGMVDGVNRYQALGDNPVGFRDPSGRGRDRPVVSGPAVSQDSVQTRLIGEVFFETDSAELDRAEREAIRTIADMVKSAQRERIHPLADVTLRVVGNADERAGQDYNAILAEARATEVAAALQGELGLENVSVSVTGTSVRFAYANLTIEVEGRGETLSSQSGVADIQQSERRVDVLLVESFSNEARTELTRIGRGLRQERLRLLEELGVARTMAEYAKITAAEHGSLKYKSYKTDEFSDVVALVPKVVSGVKGSDANESKFGEMEDTSYQFHYEREAARWDQEVNRLKPQLDAVESAIDWHNQRLRFRR